MVLLAGKPLVALSHLAIRNQRGDAGLMQRTHVLVAVIAGISGHEGVRPRMHLGLPDHGQQHGLL
jgi:hypothetical protein